MDLKKGIMVAALIGLTAFAAAGCSNGSGTTSVAQQPAVTTTPAAPATQAPPPDNSTRPALPTDNGTMPVPPQGGIQGEMQAMPEIDYAAVAAKLGVTEEQLKAAFGDTEQGPPDMAAAAQTLGISEDELRAALGFAAGGPLQGGPPPDSAAPTTP
jgi:hypothetical protein